MEWQSGITFFGNKPLAKITVPSWANTLAVRKDQVDELVNGPRGAPACPDRRTRLMDMLRWALRAKRFSNYYSPRATFGTVILSPCLSNSLTMFLSLSTE